MLAEARGADLGLEGRCRPGERAEVEYLRDGVRAKATLSFAP